MRGYNFDTLQQNKVAPCVGASSGLGCNPCVFVVPSPPPPHAAQHCILVCRAPSSHLPSCRQSHITDRAQYACAFTSHIAVKPSFAILYCKT